MKTCMDLDKMVKSLREGAKINLACNPVQWEGLLGRLTDQTESIGAVFREDKLNERLAPREYLEFFCDLWGSKARMEQAVSAMHLQDLLDTPIHKMNYSQCRRVAFAREILHPVGVYCLQEPLRGLAEEEAGWVLDWLEKLEGSAGVLTLSTTEQEALLLPGEAFMPEENGLRPIRPPQAAQPTIVVDKIPAKKGDSVYLLNPSEIDYAESMDGKVELYVQQAGYSCAGTLDELESKLARYGFYRCHRSYLVNMQKVREVVKWTRNSYALRLVVGEADIPLSKGRVEEMRSLYGF